MGRIRAISRWTVLGVVVAMSTAACHTSQPVAALTKVEAGTPAGMDTSYRLQVGDNVAVHFLAFPDLDDTAAIGPDGHIALRLIDDFPMAGLTLAEARKETNARYEAVLRHPGVSIMIKNYALQQVYVAGEVNTPGVIRSTVPLTAAGAIAQAGGVKLATAHAHSALLLRRKPDGTIVYYQLEFHGDLPGGDGDPILRTNDLIYVPRTPLAAVADFVTANLTRMVPVSFSYSIFRTF
jgi:polysaccharide export outer membrane protein